MRRLVLAQTFSTLPSRVSVAHWHYQAELCIQPTAATPAIVETTSVGSSVSLSVIPRQFRPGPLRYAVAGHGRSVASHVMAWISSWLQATLSEAARGAEVNRSFDSMVALFSAAKQMTSG